MPFQIDSTKVELTPEQTLQLKNLQITIMKRFQGTKLNLATLKKMNVYIQAKLGTMPEFPYAIRLPLLEILLIKEHIPDYEQYKNWAFTHAIVEWRLDYKEQKKEAP